MVVRRGGYVHRTAVYADDELGDADQANQLQKRRLIGQLDAVLGDVRHVELTIAFTNDDDAGWRERDANFLDQPAR